MFYVSWRASRPAPLSKNLFCFALLALLCFALLYGVLWASTNLLCYACRLFLLCISKFTAHRSLFSVGHSSVIS